MANLRLSMSIRASALKLVPIVVVLVGMLFFFHGSYGPFQISNGPTSTLKECSVGLILQALIFVLARAIIAVSVVPVCRGVAIPQVAKTLPVAETPPALLRC